MGQAVPATSSTSNTREQKVTASFTDTLPPADENAIPSAFATYAVEVLNRDGRGAGLSNQVRVLLAPTLMAPQDFQARVTSQGVILTWSQVSSPAQLPDKLSFIVRVSRREEGSPRRTTVGEAAIRAESSLTDSDIEWEKTYEYDAETVTKVRQADGTEAEIEGDDSPEARVFAHDVFPPGVPSGLQAVFSGPGQAPFVDLVWAPVLDADLAGYNLYRHEEGTEPVRLNSDPLKAPAYRDAKVSAGKRYFYSVTSIDVRGNESAKSGEASEAVP